MGYRNRAGPVTLLEDDGGSAIIKPEDGDGGPGKRRRADLKPDGGDGRGPRADGGSVL